MCIHLIYLVHRKSPRLEEYMWKLNVTLVKNYLKSPYKKIILCRDFCSFPFCFDNLMVNSYDNWVTGYNL